MKKLHGGGMGKFATDSLLLWGAQMAGVMLSVIASIFVTRALGPEGRGVYTWLLTFAGIGTHIALFGMETANRRLAASEPERIPALLRMNMVVVWGFGTVVAVILGGIALQNEMVRGNPLLVALAVLTIPLNGMMLGMGSILVAQHKVWQAALAAFVPKALLGVVFGLMVLLGLVSIGGTLAMNLLVCVVAALLPVWWLRHHAWGGKGFEVLPYVKTVWRTCSATYIAGLAYYLMQKVDVLMIGYYMGEAPTGFYGVASNMADLMILPIGVICAMLSTRLAAAHREGMATGLARNVVLATMGLAVAGSAFTYLIAPWLIELLFGAEFVPAARVLQLLCPAVVGLTFFMLMHNILLATGRARHLAVPALCGMLLNVVLNMMLIPPYGLVGACVASVIAYPVAGVVAWGYLGFRLGTKG